MLAVLQVPPTGRATGPTYRSCVLGCCQLSAIRAPGPTYRSQLGGFENTLAIRLPCATSVTVTLTVTKSTTLFCLMQNLRLNQRHRLHSNRYPQHQADPHPQIALPSNPSPPCPPLPPPPLCSTSSPSLPQPALPLLPSQHQVGLHSPSLRICQLLDHWSIR